MRTTQGYVPRLRHDRDYGKGPFRVLEAPFATLQWLQEAPLIADYLHTAVAVAGLFKTQ